MRDWGQLITSTLVLDPNRKEGRPINHKHRTPPQVWRRSCVDRGSAPPFLRGTRHQPAKDPGDWRFWNGAAAATVHTYTVPGFPSSPLGRCLFVVNNAKHSQEKGCPGVTGCCNALGGFSACCGRLVLDGRDRDPATATQPSLPQINRSFPSRLAPGSMQLLVCLHSAVRRRIDARRGWDGRERVWFLARSNLLQCA
jgi:hypothetical protein